MNTKMGLIGVGGMHVVPLVNPASVSNAQVISDNINMKNAHHVTMLLHFGAITADLDADITVIGSTAAAPGTNDTTFATIKFRKMTTSDVWSALTTVTDSKLDLVAAGDLALDANQMVAIEITAEDLKAASASVDLNFVRFEISAGGAYAYLLEAKAIVFGQRYEMEPPKSVIV